MMQTPKTLYEWMRNRYLERQEKLKKEAQEATEKEFTRKYLQNLKEAKTETLKFIREVLQSENIPPDRPIRELIETLAR